MKGKPGFIPAHTAIVARRRRNTLARQNDSKNKGGGSTDKAMLQTAMTRALDDVPFILFNRESLIKYEEQKAKVIREYGFLPKRQPQILDGSVLPRRYEPVPTYFYGKPIEELENGIYEKTFCVLSMHFSKNYVNRLTATRSFFVFSPWNVIRKTCVYLLTNQYFDYLMILTILLNCVFLALSTPIDEAEYVFLAIYTTEMMIKAIAKGFILNKYTYLRNPWNWLDFLVILLGFVTIFADLGKLSGLRTFRVLRALKTVSILPGLKTIVNALLHSIKMLSEVMLLTIFCIMVFALFALQIYVGALRTKCVRNPDWNASAMNETQYFDYTQNESNWYPDESTERVGDFAVCGTISGSFLCPDNYTCLPDIGDNPNYGFTNFDSFGAAMLSTFQLITLDFWEDIYNKIIGALGPIHVIFFIIVVFFGSFYLVNLMLAVVAMAYEEEAENTQTELSYDRQLGEDSQNGQAPKKKKKRIITRRGAITITDPLSDTEMEPNEVASEPPQPTSLFPAPLPQAPSIIEENKPPPTTSDVRRSIRKSNPEISANVPYSRYNGVTTATSPKRVTFNTSQQNPLAQSESPMPGVPIANEPVIGEPLNKTLSNGQLSTTITTSKSNMMEVPPTLISRDSAASTGTNTYQRALSELYRSAPSLDEDGKPFHAVIIKNELPDRNCECCPRYCFKYRIWLMFQKFVYFIVYDPLVELFITFCIILNTVFLAIEHAGMSTSLKEVLNLGNKVFTAIFTIETTLKLICFSKEYFKNSWNVFDLIIVFFSLVELGLEGINGLSVLRALRLLRVFKLAQSWTTMRVLLSIILSTIGALGNLTLVLVIIMYIFAIMGMQLFGSNYTKEKFKGEVPRWNFQDFVHSFMMIFRILCGEWIEPMWDCMLVNGQWCMAIFIPTLIVGNFMVLNLFLALLLSSFNSESLSNNNKKDEEASRLMLGFKRLKFIFCCCCECVWAKARQRGKSKSEVVSYKPEIVVKPDVIPVYSNNAYEETEEKVRPNSAPINSYPRQVTPYDSRPMTVAAIEDIRDQVEDESEVASRKISWTPVVDYVDNLRHGSLESLNVTDTLLQVGYPSTKIDAATQTVDGISQLGSPEHSAVPTRQPTAVPISHTPPPAPRLEHKDSSGGNSQSNLISVEDSEPDIPLVERNPEDCFPQCFYKRLCCCKALLTSRLAEKWFQFRKKVIHIVDHSIFEWGIIILIFSSSICLCFEDVYLEDNPTLKTVLFYLNLFFCAVYTLEMLLKWLAHGFVVYFSNGWSTLDFIIVIASIFSVIVEGDKKLVALRSVRTLRALRPLRAISRWQGMKIVVNALMSAIPAIFNVLLVCIVFWLIFSIMGVQFFAGRFYKCVDGDEKVDISIVKNKTECEQKNYTWKNEDINFDNVGQGYLALFQVATFEGWMEVMEAAVDSKGVDLQPEFEANLPAYLYFIIFIVCGSFFTLNLFIGVIIDNFNMLKKKYEGTGTSLILTESQKNYFAAMKKLGRKKPQKLIRRPINKCQAFFYDLSMSRRFEMFVFVIIVANMISMGIDHYKMPKETEYVLELLNKTFTAMFVVEAIIKIIGLRQYYFTVPWNVFDFILVLSSIVGILLKDLTTNFVVSPTLLRVVRVFRIGRILRLIKAAKGIRKLLFALVVSLPALFNIGALIFLIMFIYAIIGMSLFSHVKHTGVITDIVNFETFGRSILLLFRLLTSAGWNDVLEPLMVSPPNCNPDPKKHPNGDCGSATMAIVYLVSYVIINFMIVINMYIAVILENFNQAHQEEELGIVEDDLEMFYINWAKYDPRATQFISFWELTDFVDTLDPPLRIPKPNSIAIVSFNLPIAKGMKIHCLDILHALVKHVLGHVDETEDFQKLRQQMEEKFKKQFPTRKKLEMVTTTLQWKRYEFAARIVQKAYRNHNSRKRRKLDAGAPGRPSSRIGRGIHSLTQFLSMPKALPSSPGGSSRPLTAIATNSETNEGDHVFFTQTKT